jgi:DNA-binding NtrC family response regulator
MAEGLGWKLFEAASCSEALTLLQEERIPVVVCEQHLPDGNWRSLLEGIATLARRPKLIVASRLADDLLWVEVLKLGAYDLLALPYSEPEVRRVISRAWDCKRREEQDSIRVSTPAAPEVPRRAMPK